MRQTTLSNGYPISNEYGSFPRSNVRPSLSQRSMISRQRNIGMLPGVTTTTTSSSYPSSPRSSDTLSKLYEPYIHVPKVPKVEEKGKEEYKDGYHYRDYREQYEDEDQTKKSFSPGEKTLITQLPKYQPPNPVSNVISEKVSPNTLPCLLVRNHILECPICMKLYMNKWYTTWWPWIVGGIMIVFILWLWHQRCVHKALIHHLQEMNKQIQHQLSLMRSSRQSSSSSNHNPNNYHNSHHNSHHNNHASIINKK
jgi:hypothetical protein